MAEVVPFRGYRYDTAVAGDVARLIAPPYDVIDPAMRDVLFSQSPHNIARLIRGHRKDGHPSGNPYADVARQLGAWRAQGVVRQDADPAIYVYEQHFEVHDRKFLRTGMIALTRLEEPGKGVMPHETTLAGPRRDRLDLLRATRTQFGQVFALYPDPDSAVDSLLDEAKAGTPLVHAADGWEHLHRLWAVSDPARIAQIQELMRGKDLLIADGHHRYETALAYAQERPDCDAAKYRMMTLVNMANVGLVVLPIHRLIKAVPDFHAKALLESLRRLFNVRSYPGDSEAVRRAVLASIAAEQAAGRHAFGLFVNDGRYYEFVLRHADVMADIPDRSETWRRLDVVVLHHLVLEGLLGITLEHLQAEAHVAYVQDFPHAIREAAQCVSDGESQALFLLNPTRIDDVRTVAQNGERMPQKSTFFYPKVFTGLVFNRVD